MENIFSHIRNKISAEKSKREERQTGEEYKKNIKQVLVTLGLVVCILLFLGLKDLYESGKLSKYGVQTYCTVFEISYLPKHRDYLTKCIFHVNGKEYQAKYPLNRPLKYGDTLQVLYYPENPKINKLIIPDSLNINNRIRD